MSAATARVFAPATVANVAVGFDILGFPVDALGDTITVERLPASPGSLPEVRLAGVEGVASFLPTDPERNTATLPLIHLVRDLGLPFGFRVSVRKGIPLSSGMGGSAASSVGALVAANSLLPEPLPRESLLRYALLGEELVSGSPHGDNAAPCLLGGLTLLRSLDPVETVRLPFPERLRVVLVHPHRELDTRSSRGVLPRELPLREYVAQSARLAAFLVACYTEDLELMAGSLKDGLVEPRRAPLIQAFHTVQRAAREAGALGCSISGSGPSVFALCRNAEEAEKTRRAMTAAWEAAGVPCDSWAGKVCLEGAR
ncbi:MAG TPA: homoserine kinase, partial [Magnetospirillaceae bacterium]|nr:homoserine kinase [Magnetospirillaceae bacterium]